jgi:hypothetical protein
VQKLGVKPEVLVGICVQGSLLEFRLSKRWWDKKEGVWLASELPLTEAKSSTTHP